MAATGLEEKYDAVKQLIAIGKDRGYLLYDEVNDSLPAEVHSSEEIDDLLTTFVITSHAPVFIAPAMNDEMYANPIVRDNCAKLKKHGFKFIEPVKGKLACGTVGVGHLAEVEDIVKTILK